MNKHDRSAQPPLEGFFTEVKPSKLSSFPPEVAIATVQFSIEQDEMPELSEAASIFGGVSATLIEIPVDAVKAAFMSIPEFADAHANFDAYHAWYVSQNDTPHYGAEDRWPCIASARDDDVFLDGSHRFHSYIRAGHKTIPVLMFNADEWWAAHAVWMSAKQCSQQTAKHHCES